MKKILFISVALLCSFGQAWGASIRTVTRPADENSEGTLRSVLRNACNDDGDDIIRFHRQLGDTNMELAEPLVIPEDCKGAVTIQGSSEIAIGLDGSALTAPGADAQPGDFCTLYVYSEGNTIENLSFTGNSLGAGVCLFGRNNTVSSNHFGPNKYGVVISDIYHSTYPRMDGRANKVMQNNIGPEIQDGIWVYSDENSISGNEIADSYRGLVIYGDGNQVIQNHLYQNQMHGLRVKGDNAVIKRNTITGNGRHGIWMNSAGSVIAANTISNNGGCPESLKIISKDCMRDVSWGGFGIVIAQGSSNIKVGGESFEKEGNTIQFNNSGGILVSDDEENLGHTITHNRISKNYGLGIDLGNDGVSINDSLDEDSGPNGVLNYMDYVQAFPMVPSSKGLDRYWAWGLAKSGKRLELYGVNPDDAARGMTNGGGDVFLADASIDDSTFTALFSQHDFLDFDYMTILSFDEEGNTSEFSQNVAMGPDADLDGIPDFLEDGPSASSTAEDLADSDGDGLPDSVEDNNRNGIWDEGETAGFRADTDGDGLPDGVEVHYDGIYNPGVDTNPLLADTDLDGISDGREDLNHNGIWDAYLGETSPLWRDSDRDHYNDGADTCPALYNPGQEVRYCRE